jgi:hypothetical protein
MDSNVSLASASFSDRDAGSGPVHSSPNSGPIRGAVHAISARNIHEIGAVVPDDKQFLRSWRRQLHDCVQNKQAQVVRFLFTGVSDETILDAEVVRRYNDILEKYSRPSWNTMNIHDITFHTDLSQTNMEIEQDIGISSQQMRDSLRRVIRMFVNSANAMCSSEIRLEEKLTRFETIVSRINDLMFLEPTTALPKMDGPVREYLDSVLDKIRLEDDYTELMENFKTFSVLQSLLRLANFQKTVGPTCTICMTNDIKQATIPCGHTFCDECCRAQMTSCYICRVQIRDKIRIYF